MKEVWKQAKGIQFYQVSSYGRVRNKDKKILSQRNSKDGYKRVQMARKTKSVHRLVLEAFKPKPENKTQCNHIDGNKQNNHIDNLEWVTDYENKLHYFKLKGFHHDPNKPKRKRYNYNRTGMYKNNSGGFKLTPNDVIRIRRLVANGVRMRKIAIHYGVSKPTICEISKGKKWKRIK